MFCSADLSIDSPGSGRTQARPVSRQPDQYAADRATDQLGLRLLSPTDLTEQ